MFAKSAATAAIMAVIATASPAFANEFKPQIDAFFQSNIEAWLASNEIVDAIKAQNTKHAKLNADTIDALDQKWRAEAKAGEGELVNSLLGNDLSRFLSAKKAAHDTTITEIFVMDNKGLNVGQSDVTSDYMQGDEAKWTQTFGTGGQAVFIDEVEFDDSTQSFQSQISATIIDPATGQAIGAITIGLNVEDLL